MFIKAAVVSVDSERRVCKCRMETTGETLLNVYLARPIGGGENNPSIGDRVAIWNDGAQLWAMFVLDRLSVTPPYEPSIAYNVEVPLAASSSIPDGMQSKSHGVRGAVAGDKVISTRGGAIIAALRGGSILLKVSALCQVFLSRFDDLLKVTSRNFEQYTDARSVVSVSGAGGTRPYTYEEVYMSLPASRNGVPTYKHMTGDVALASAKGLNYRDGDTLPATSTIVCREGVINAGGQYLYRRDLTLSGGSTTVYTNTVDSVTVTVSHSSYSVSLVNGSHSVSIALSSSGDATITGTGTIEFDFPNAHFTGNVLVDGDVTTPGGVTLLKHKHPSMGAANPVPS